MKTAEEKFKLGTELIKKHLESWDGLTKASIEHYAQNGKVSGSLYTSLLKMMEEYANQSQSARSVRMTDEKLIIDAVKTFAKIHSDFPLEFQLGAEFVLEKIQTLNVDSGGFEEWIDVKDRLPESNEYILVWNEHTKQIEISFYDKDINSFGGKRLNITYWMPLPKTPRTVQKK